MMQKTMEKPSEKEALESDIETLKKIKDGLEKEAEQVRVRHNAEIEKRFGEARRADAEVMQKRDKFEADKKEFEGILKAFQFDKAKLDKDREDLAALKKDAQAAMDKVGIFIRMVRDGAAKL